MATWKQVRDCLLSEFDNSSYDEENDLLGIGLSWDDGRSQFVNVFTGEGKSKTWIHIVSEIGNVNKNDIYPLLREVENTLSGGIVAIEDSLYYRIAICMNDSLELNHIVDCISIAGVLADTLEEKYVGGDES